MTREQMLANLEETTRIWDVIVIGGGATGLGTALEAASRGYQTLLVEAADFANGTSSRSTKLIHGGVRYLRQGKLSMVRQSLRERGRLLRNAPSIVHPLNFVIPSYRIGRRWYFYAGLKAYDMLAGKLNLEPARLLNARQTSELLPTLNNHQLRGGVMYGDGQFDDAALAMALATTAVEQGATLLNYTPVVRLLKRGDKLTGLVAHDLEGQREFEVQGKVIVNATGVFAESILQLDRGPADQGAMQPKITPSQGTHVVVSRAFLPTDRAIMIPDTDDGRVLFAIPWLNHTLIGTTDMAVDKIELDPQPQISEVDYLLEHVGRYLTKSPQRQDVLSTFAGLRPLVAQAGKSTSQLSREHLIDLSPSGLISVIGGKWTTYRQMGEEIVDLAAKLAELPRRVSVTATLALDGPSKAKSSLSSAPASLGENGHASASATAHPADGHKNIAMHPELALTECEIDEAVSHQWARTVDDVLARRSRALFLNASAALSVAPRVARRMAMLLGRDRAWEEAQLASFERLAAGYRIEPS